MSSVHGDNFTSSFPIWNWEFIAKLLWLELFNIMLNGSGNSGYPCFVPDLKDVFSH